MTTPEPFDVAIIGAGINGAGLFRDLCAQGLRVILIDKGDFGSGTSAAPSRMIHGGLKYLETGQFGLVAQSTLERNLLLRNAPHLVRPLPTMIPLHSWWGGIGPAIRTLFGSKTAGRSRGAALIEAGLLVYDLFGSRGRVMPRHRLMGRARTRAAMPHLAPDIIASALYHDARVTHPERLVLELVQEGLAANAESVALNWTSLAGLDRGALTLVGPQGTRHVAPRLVVNAAGPWIDRVNAVLGQETRFIGGTKGSHILLDHPALLTALDGRMLYFEADDGRLLLIYGYEGRVLMGTSDLPDDDPDAAACTEPEVDYFLTMAKRVLPAIAINRDQIVYAYSGIRPLPRSDAAAPGLISRDHSTPTLPADATRPFDVISLVGGKWTTFRGFAEEVADDVLARLGAGRSVSTRDLPIGGGRDFPKGAARAVWVARVAAATGQPAQRIEGWLDRYGTRAEAIAAQVTADDRTLPGTDDMTQGEIDWIVRHEAVVHLQDLVLRRTQLAIAGRLSAATLAAMAQVTGAALGWDDRRLATELAQTTALLQDRHRARL